MQLPSVLGGPAACHVPAEVFERGSEPASLFSPKTEVGSAKRPDVAPVVWGVILIYTLKRL